MRTARPRAAAKPRLARTALCLVALLPALLLGACGKKGDPEPPPGVESAYPRQYPGPEGT